MHQTQWSPERPLPPPVSLTSQETHVKNQIMEKVNSFNGLQQKAFYNMLMGSNPKSKYIINDDEFDDFQLNLYNKWNTLLGEASRF